LTRDGGPKAWSVGLVVTVCDRSNAALITINIGGAASR
jgi:hypothetical protein